MSITMTPSQAVALAQLAREQGSVLGLHQVVGDQNLFVTTGGQGEPDMLIRDNGTVERVEAVPLVLRR